MKIVFLKINWLLLLLLSALSSLSISAQTPTPTPTPSLNIVTIPKTQNETNINRNSLYLNVLASRLATKNLTIENFCPQDNILTKRILKDYGAVFVGNGQYASPCYMRDEKCRPECSNSTGNFIKYHRRCAD